MTTATVTNDQLTQALLEGDLARARELRRAEAEAAEQAELERLRDQALAAKAEGERLGGLAAEAQTLAEQIEATVAERGQLAADLGSALEAVEAKLGQLVQAADRVQLLDRERIKRARAAEGLPPVDYSLPAPEGDPRPDHALAALARRAEAIGLILAELPATVRDRLNLRSHQQQAVIRLREAWAALAIEEDAT